MFPYNIAAIDPGLTTGFAHYDPQTGKFRVIEDTDPAEIYQELKAHLLNPKPLRLLIEDFIGGGHLTKEAKHTLKVLGAFQFGTCTLRGIDEIIIRSPQKRLSSVNIAKQMMRQNGHNTRKNFGADALSAFAHCLSYYREEASKNGVTVAVPQLKGSQ